MLVVHANWSLDALHVWGESLERALESGEPVGNQHPFAASHAQVKSTIEQAMGSLDGAHNDTLTLLLPHATGCEGSSSSIAIPLPSSKLASLMGRAPSDEEALVLEACTIPTIRLDPEHALSFFSRVADLEGGQSPDLALAHSMHWWTRLTQLALDSIIDQRVIPTLVQRRDGSLSGQWRPWLNDSDANAHLADLIASMPAAVRAVDGTKGHAWPIVDSFLSLTTDAAIRTALIDENFEEAIADFSTSTDAHAGFLSGLLGPDDSLKVGKRPEFDLMRTTRGWLGVLDGARAVVGMRLKFEIHEPEVDAGDEGLDASWRVSFSLVDPDDPGCVTDAETIFQAPSGRRNATRAPRSEELAQMLLKELGRASRIWPELEDALQDETPCGVDLNTREAYTFMRDLRPVLLEAGFFVDVPVWWGEPTSRISARLLIDSPESPPGSTGSASSAAHEPSGLGLQALVAYRWQVALGSQSVSIEMLERLARRGSPLVRVNGAWVDLRPEDIASAVKFFREHPGGTMSLVEALRMAHGIDGPPEALPVSGVTASGWVKQLLDASENDEGFRMAGPPEAFQGTLRPYQLTGLSWLAFLDRLGLGACLADDMGLGKTIQLIVLMQHERAQRTLQGLGPPGPTLLVAPMSVLGNWKRELGRFAPELKVHIQHGIDRPTGDAFTRVTQENDLVITTYAIVVRDRDTIQKVQWRRVALDEAQYIKNPPTKQTAAIRALNTRHRVALTGTPVENRLAELWSIMEFCCPGYLGTHLDFRRRFATPIERNRDGAVAQRLRALVKPFILRRLKTDPKVISDLPPLIESRQSIPLTDEQIRLYETVVAEMLAKVDQADGIRRRGLVLSALVKLKQICNHPAHFLREGTPNGTTTTAKRAAKATEAEDPAIDAEEGSLLALPSAALNPARSGKTQRLIELLDELVAAGDSALVFTQYRQMGHLLVSMIRQAIDVEALFLHGGTPQAKRDSIVDRFQKGDRAHPIFVLSLKAGGVGLNLTAANHVIHFDRWWNPAVENQATDRAFRIGQTRTVNVHKFICAGTLEERIDQMIEQKTELATQIIGSGDGWLTEMSTNQLRDLLSLRRSGLEGSE